MKPLIPLAIACIPCLVSAASSESFTLNTQHATAAGVSTSQQFVVDSLVGAAVPGGRSMGGAYALKTGLRPDARFDRPTATLSAWPTHAIVGQPLVLRAMIASGASTAGNVRFTENGAPLGGCAAVPMQTLAGSTAGVGIATCRIEAANFGTHHYVAQFMQASDGVPAEIALDVASTASVATDYTGLWWGGASQNGWGISIAQHGGVQFNVLYTYDTSGKPLWYVMPGGTWDGAGTTFSGALYESASAPFDAYVASRMQVGAAVGNASIRFASASAAQIDYTIDGIKGSKAIERQLFALEDAAPRLQVDDMWWAGEMQNGWGVNIAQQGRTLFVTWFSYDANGEDTWFVVPGGSWKGTAFTGDLFTTTSSPWLGAAYSPAAFKAVKMGSMTLDFADAGWASMTYTVGGVTQTKTIVRQPY